LKPSSSQNAGSKATSSLQEFFSTVRNGMIHPVTGLAFAYAFKLHALHAECFSDQAVQVDAASHDISTNYRRRYTAQTELATNLIQNLQREKGGLSLIVLAVIKEAVPSNPPACDAFDRMNFHVWVRVWFLAVMPEEIVPWRNVQVADCQVSVYGQGMVPIIRWCKESQWVISSRGCSNQWAMCSAVPQR
jgi:hypothetical protein